MQEERRKRHDVKQHFSRLGWTFRPGPELSYDHYYIKPGKNPRNKKHIQGEDYFLGEAELVAYARKMKIFGEETAPLPVVDGLERTKRREHSNNSSARTRQLKNNLDSEFSDNDSTQRLRREHKRHRRRSDEHKVGNSVHNPIALSSDSSDDDYTRAAIDTASSAEEDEKWSEEAFDVEEDQESEKDASSSASEDSNEEGELDVGTSSHRPRKAPSGKSKSDVDTEPQKIKDNAKTKAEIKPTLKEKFQPTSDDAPDESDTEEYGRNHTNPRPLLTTAHRKRNGAMHTLRKHRQSDSIAASSNAIGSDEPRGKKRAVTGSKDIFLATITGKKSKSAPRSLLRETDNPAEGAWEDNDDNSFDLGVEECGESPPRRPPPRAHSRSSSVRSSPSTSVAAASPFPPDMVEEQKEKTMTDSFAPTIFQSVLSPSTNALMTPTLATAELAKTATSDSSRSAQVSMELTQVVLPPDRDNKYHIRVTVSADKPPVHTIWMENLLSHEQREYSFVDVTKLPGAQNDIRVPTTTVLTALFRCLSSQPDAEVVVGPEPRATAESKTAFEKGEVQLLTSTAEKNAGEANGGDKLTLVVAYPALDLFRRLQHLAQELERLKEQLSLVQTDRDNLCKQLRQLEEENERTLSQQVGARLRTDREAQDSRLQQRQSSEDVEHRVTKLVEKKTHAFIESQEKENRHRERARKWVFVQSTVPSTGNWRFYRHEDVSSPTRNNHRYLWYVVEWKEVIDIAEPLFQTADTSESGSTRSISVVKDGLYQVNVNVSHDSLVQLRLMINPAKSDEGAAFQREAREIAPTKVSLYENKRRVSRVDMTLDLHASDQLSLELRLSDSAALPSVQEEWLRAPMPTHNRLLVVAL
ncbi:hypothetical protein PInf_022793 [Phytophthora infestans]|nr:hypothetical protein PInf_022793 [Phytophthora infestans]